MSTEEPLAARELEQLLRRLDHEPPRITAEDVIARAGGARSSSPAAAAGERIRRHAPLRRAAGVILALAAGGAAYAIPGSPLPRWIAGLRAGPEATSVAPAPAPAPPTGALPAQVSGIEVSEPVTNVIITTRVEGGQLRVLLVESETLTARAPAGAARFTAEPDRVLIELLRADTVVLLVPRAAPRLEIAAGGRVLLRVQGGRVVVPARPLPPDSYRFPLTP